MKLKKLFDSLEFEEVFSALKKLYPDPEPHEPSYLAAWKELEKTEPIDSDTIIGVFWRPPDDLNEQGFWDVSGQMPGSEYGDQFIWGLGFSPWNEWLGMEIDEEILQIEEEALQSEVSHAEIMAHVIWEMTFHGYSWEESVNPVGDHVGCF